MADYPECPVCKDIYGNKEGHIKEPKILKCGHSICKECLEALIKDENEEFFSCPKCKEKIKNLKDVDEYITNKGLIEMVVECFINQNNKLMQEELGKVIPFKIISLGESSVGKTSIFKRLSKDDFTEKHLETTSFEKGTYYIKYKNKNYKLTLQDTVGSEKYRAVARNYLRNPDGVLFIFDISDRKSFDELEFWYNLYKEENEKVVGLLIGNKCDLDDRKVSEEEAEKFADEHGLKYLETSAKLDKKVRKAIACLLEIIINENIQKKHYCQIDNFSAFSQKKKKKKKNCC